MSAFPNDIKEKWKQANEPSKDYSKARESNIENPEEERRRKLLMLDNMVTDKINERMEALKQDINTQIQGFLAQLQPQAQQNQTPPEMPPEIKAEAIAKVGGALAEVVKAWKGSSSTPSDDYFGTMSKNMMLQIIQAGLDGIFKNVYPTYNPPAPNPVRFEPQQPLTKPGKISFE